MTRAVLAVVLAILCAPRLVAAHKLSDAHVHLALNGDQINGRVDIALVDLDAALVLDANGDGALTWGEVRASEPRIAAYVESHLTLAGDAGSCPRVAGAAALVDLSDGTYWAQPFIATCTAEPHALTIAYSLLFDLDPQHQGLIHLAARGTSQTLIARDASPVTAVLGARTSVAAFVKEGVLHIWSGTDHILFLLCLIVPAVYQRRTQRWVPADSLRDVSLEVLEVVTAFTLAHSITLVIAAIGLVHLPSRLVETAIALSVFAAAANNLVRWLDARWAVAFTLGLLHGFGFSAVLVDLGLPPHELIGALLGFNLGVELGQSAIVLLALPLLYTIRRTAAYQALLWGGSGAVAFVALLWAYQRL